MLAFDGAEQNRSVEALREVKRLPADVSLAIHRADDMFLFTLDECGGLRDLALTKYFLTGSSAVDAVGRLFRAYFPRDLSELDVLDMASGFGRTTRFLGRLFDPRRTWVSEIVDGAVAFQETAFGVHGVPSTATGEAFEPGRRFDAIFVLSLFSHLPEASFRGWLQRLIRLLQPGGCLVFSTHGPRALPAGEELRGGFRFEASSESTQLAGDVYGSAWVSAEYVRTLVTDADATLGVRRFERGLWQLQDLYVVGNPKKLAELDCAREPEGFVEFASVRPDRMLRISGWAIDPGGDHRPTVRVQVGARGFLETVPGLARPDVGSAFGDARFAASGWTIEFPAEPDPVQGHEIVTVLVQGSSGDRLLHVGSLDALTGLSKACEARYLYPELSAVRDRLARSSAQFAGICEERDRLAQTIAWMERSKFWKLRQAWWGLRGGQGWARSAP